MTVNRNVIAGIAAVAALAAIFWYGGHKPKQAVIEKPAPTVVTPPVTKPPVAKPGTKPNPPTYHRVVPGGGKGDAIACKSVVPYAQGKTPQELAVAAKQLGVTQAELARYFVCVTE